MRLAFFLLLLAGSVGCSTTQFAPGEVLTTARYVVPTPAAAEPGLTTLIDTTQVIPILGLLKGARDERVRGEVAEALKAKGLDMSLQFHEELERQLAAQGFDEGPYITYRARLRSDAYPRARDLPRGGAMQLFIDTSILHGFVAAATGAEFRPYVSVQLQILAADTHEVLYKRAFFANYPTLGTDAIKVELPADIPTWGDVENIKRDIPRVDAAFKDIVAVVAKQITEQLQNIQPIGTK